MKILTFRMDFADKKWADYLTEEFGEETAKKFNVQSHAAAKIHDAKITMLNFDGDKSLIEKIKNHPKVTSAYIVKNDKEYPIELSQQA